MATSRVTNAEDIKKLGTIVSVWAHPDDETFSCAGIMMVAAEQGQTVACVTATKGEAGVQDETRWPPARLAEIRAAELAAALKLMGISRHHWLDYHDGRCAEADTPEAAAKLRYLLRRYQPDTILTFGPDGLTGHPDHCIVSRWVSLAAEGLPAAIYHAVQTEEQYEKMHGVDEQFNIFFNIDRPPCKANEDCDIYFVPRGTTHQKKYQALQAMSSQTEAMLKAAHNFFATDGNLPEAFILAKNR